MIESVPYPDWEPVYAAICADFGFDPNADARARDVAAEWAEPVPESALGQFAGDTVAVVGAAPSLAAELELFDPTSVDSVIAASTAVDVVADAGISVDLMVTDLDKNVATARDLTHAETPVAAHAHGDNIPALREWLPQFDAEWTLVTTQAEPRESVLNTGGFTDGDRAAFLADALGARQLRFLGWTFDDPTVEPMKARKLQWAEHLLYWLERRREERFAILDGRRDALTTDLTTLSTSA